MQAAWLTAIGVAAVLIVAWLATRYVMNEPLTPTEPSPSTG
jgi:hypothetical protein